jgi:hypothetical protein
MIFLTEILNKNTTSNIECVKGDIQLGKRVHACILMWISIYIFTKDLFLNNNEYNLIYIIIKQI